MLSIMTKQTIYVEGFESFIPTSTDNPDCVPFYRAWKGMTAAIGKESMDRWHHLLHQAICWSLQAPTSEQYASIIRCCKTMIADWKQPEAPRPSYSYNCPPSEPTEHDARELFNREYKIAFPTKRANSKHANEFWANKRDQAMEIVVKEYQAKLASFEQRESELESKNVRNRDAWIEKFWDMALFEDFVRRLEVN